jgi:hypothetical protein
MPYIPDMTKAELKLMESFYTKFLWKSLDKQFMTSDGVPILEKEKIGIRKPFISKEEMEL